MTATNTNNNGSPDASVLLNKEEEKFRSLVEESDAQFIPLTMDGGGRSTHVTSEPLMDLMENNITLKDLKQMTNKFYEKAFQDETLDKFIHSHSDPHGSRFAKWIHQKLTGSNVWDKDRKSRQKKKKNPGAVVVPHVLADGQKYVVHDRTSAHVAAWNSTKRPKEEVGRHFQLDECRVWMRLHFWALRESGLIEKSPAFANYYIRFIGHFVRIYESTAPQFARESFRWSASSDNIKTYEASGRKMTDVLGLTLREAMRQIPSSEAKDLEWPYNNQA